MTDDDPIAIASPDNVLPFARGYDTELAERVKMIVDARVFSKQLLAWASNPLQEDSLPNAALMAGVLVELCHRLDALEARAMRSRDELERDIKAAFSETHVNPASPGASTLIRAIASGIAH